MARVRRTIVCALLLCHSASASAQDYTLADVFQRLNAGQAIVNFAVANPPAHARIAGLQSYAEAAGLAPMRIESLSRIYAGAPPDFATVLRWDRDQYAHPVPAGFRDSLVALSRLAHGSLQTALSAAIGKDSLDSLYRPIDLLLQQVLERGVAANAERLRRFAIKYGPDSPRLNVVEAGLNYVGQLVAPGLLLGSDGAPSPFELVASYRTTDLTASRADSADRALRLVSSVQLGMRWYNFAVGCGEGSRLNQLTRPCHASAGAFLMGPSDTPLTRFTGAGHRTGAYVAWGDLHAGYVLGQEKRLVFGVDTQVLPYLF